MNKLQAMEWGAKLIEAIASMPDNADIHGFTLSLNTDTKPYHKELTIHLSGRVDMPAVTGKKYSGWHEMRVYTKPDVYAWWSQNTEDDKDDSDS